MMDFLDGLSDTDVTIIKSLIDKDMDDDVIHKFLVDDVRYNKYLKWKGYNTFLYDLPDSTWETIDRLLQVTVEDNVISAFLDDDSRMELYKIWKAKNQKKTVTTVSPKTESPVPPKKKIFHFTDFTTTNVSVAMTIPNDCIKYIFNNKNQVEKHGVKLKIQDSAKDKDKQITKITGPDPKVEKAEAELCKMLLKAPEMESLLGFSYYENDLEAVKVEKTVKLKSAVNRGMWTQIDAASDAVGIVVGKKNARKQSLEKKHRTNLIFIRHEEDDFTTIRVSGENIWAIINCGMEIQEILSKSAQFTGKMTNLPPEVTEALQQMKGNNTRIFNFQRITNCVLDGYSVKGWTDEQVKHAVDSYLKYLRSEDKPKKNNISTPRGALNTPSSPAALVVNPPAPSSIHIPPLETKSKLGNSASKPPITSKPAFNIVPQPLFSYRSIPIVDRNSYANQRSETPVRPLPNYDLSHRDSPVISLTSNNLPYQSDDYITSSLMDRRDNQSPILSTISGSYVGPSRSSNDMPVIRPSGFRNLRSPFGRQD